MATYNYNLLAERMDIFRNELMEKSCLLHLYGFPAEAHKLFDMQVFTSKTDYYLRNHLFRELKDYFEEKELRDEIIREYWNTEEARQQGW